MVDAVVEAPAPIPPPTFEQRVRRARAEGLRPEIQLTVSQWADAHRRLPQKSSAEPGPWRTDRTPYLKEIMDCMSTTSEVEEVVFMKSAQVGGTEAILNMMGYVIDHAPGPMIVIQPTVELAKRFSRQRVEPLITVTPRIAAKVADARARDSGNTMLGKEYPGGQLVLTGANSAVGLRSMPAQYALMDEVDGYPVDVDEEGSPIALVEARQRTFARKKRMKVSTPTIAGRSAIEAAFEDSDQRRYYVPCPDCGEMQPLVFAQLTWSKLSLAPEAAVYECRACFYQIQSHEKTALLARGEWRAEKPERIGKIRGYHLNALYAPVGWMSWGDIARQFVDVHKDPEKYRVFINTVLGEVWTAKGEAPAWEGLQRRRESYAIGTVPQEVVFLTAGVDVQKDRVVYEVVGWGRGKRSWSIDYGELPGDTADLDDGPWSAVDELLARSFPHASGQTMPIRMLAVDSGYNTQTVYGWARRYPLNRVVAVKGQDHGGVLVGSPTPVEITDRGRKLKRGGRLWPVCVNIAKSEFYGWLRLEAPTDGSEPPPGYCHFPQYHDEYFRQLTSEQLVAHKTRRGFIRLEWELIPGRQNHVLDARVYARAAAYLAGLDRLTPADWASREQLLQPPPPTSTTPSLDASTTPSPPASRGQWLKPRQRSWLKKGES
jgi:phage terminase large subunit GpA-like protein